MKSIYAYLLLAVFLVAAIAFQRAKESRLQIMPAPGDLVWSKLDGRKMMVVKRDGATMLICRFKDECDAYRTDAFAPQELSKTKDDLK